MNFIINCIKGIALGAGAILPGISSGVLCVIFGIYEKLVDSVLNFFSDMKNNFKFLFPIIVGIAVGVVLFGNVLRFLFNNFPIQTKFCFIGVILGGIPALAKNANSKKGFRLHYLIYTVCTFMFTVLLLYIEHNVLFSNIETNVSFLYLILSGFVMSIGVVVPGISSTVLLMLMGMYDTYLLAISTVNLHVLIPMGIGLLLGGYLFLMLIKYFLDKYHTQTYYAIIGFALGSIIILYPGTCFNFAGFMICIIGFCISRMLGDL